MKEYSLLNEKEKCLLLLSQFEMAYKKLDNIVNYLGDKMSVNALLESDRLSTFFNEEIVASLKICGSEIRLREYYHNLVSSGITLLTFFTEGYPDKLKHLPDKPYFLFCKGDLSLLNEKGIAIVGSRTLSNYGRIVTDRFSGELASNGLVIISGLAYGVDSISHRKALEVGGKTIAVLGSGFNNIYPAEHKGLAKEIVEKGLLISEYCPSMTSTKYNFPHRNRIIAGLSEGVLITEAGMKSGTNYTKDFALDYGKTVYAVPGDITNQKSELPNHIIKTGQAQCVTSAKDILEFLQIKPKELKKKTFQVSIEEQEILDFLSSGEKDVEFLSENTGLSANILNSCLTTLEIRGIIRRLPGGFYTVS